MITSTFPWTQVASRIDLLIKQERYISPEVLKEIQQERIPDLESEEPAEWVYNEHSKFEATLEPAYQVGDTVFLEGEAYNTLPLELLMYSCCHRA